MTRARTSQAVCAFVRTACEPLRYIGLVPSTLRLQRFCMLSVVQRVRDRLDARVIGHVDAKEAMMLALFAREHVLIEGPPGTAKTCLAEEFAHAVGAAPFVVQLHRDTKVEDLIGKGSVLRRERDDFGNELISHAATPGGLLVADVCVLDDVSRAPGPVMAALFRALAERRGASQNGGVLPLKTVVATACVGSASWESDVSRLNECFEKLDLALLDRFALQLSLSSTLLGGHRVEAGRIMGRQSRHVDEFRLMAHDISSGNILKSGELVQQAVDCVTVPHHVRQMLLKIVKRLVYESSRATALNGVPLLTDRTFLVKSLRLLRAKAVLMGRDACLAEDLFVLRFLTTFRVPPEVHKKVVDIICDVKADAEREAPRVISTASETSGEQLQAANSEEEIIDNHAGGDSLCAPDKIEEVVTSGPANESNRSDAEVKGSCGDVDAVQEACFSEDGMAMASVAGSGSRCASDDDIDAAIILDEHKQSLQLDDVSVENIDIILSKITGSIDRGRSELIEHSGGSPRRWCAWNPRDCSSFSDVDAIDMHRWSCDPSPAAWPRAQQRMKRDKGGLLVVLRDISMSMSGVNAIWSSRLVVGLLDALRERHMRCGYIEFNHRSQKHRYEDGAFFGDDYVAISKAAMSLRCGGWTNYQRPLADAIDEFTSLGPSSVAPFRNGQRHMLLITDGVPTHGDPHVRRERARIREFGIVVHSVYIGWPRSYPAVLDSLSTSTNGSQFWAFYETRSKGVVGHSKGDHRWCNDVDIPFPAGGKVSVSTGLESQDFDNGYFRVLER